MSLPTEPPLGGSRGADALDVVVWFGNRTASHVAASSSASGMDSAASVGWPQRILTVGGVKHRTGEDPHSKHTTEARNLVESFYELHSSKREDQSGSTVATPAVRKPPSGATAVVTGWSPGPLVKKFKSDGRPRSACSPSSSSHAASCDDVDQARGEMTTVDPEDDSDRHPSAHHRASPSRSYYRPATTTAAEASSAGIGEGTSNRIHSSSLFGRRKAALADAMPRDSISLRLLRTALERQGDAFIANGQHAGGRPPSGKRGVGRSGSIRQRRPLSACSATSSNMSLEEARRSSSGRSTAPKSASDFPSVDKCRNLDCTIALTRAAAVIDRVESGDESSGAPRGRGLIGMGYSTTPVEAATTQKASKSDGSQQHRPSSATITALRNTLGHSIMHTIRTTNAQQLLKVKHDMGLNGAEMARQASSHAQRLAHERILYKHIPADDAARLKLRQGLEEMQTEFARREIDALMDDFKRRIPGSGSKRSIGLGPSATSSVVGGSGAGGGGEHSNGSSYQRRGWPTTPAALHAMLDRQQEQQQQRLHSQPPLPQQRLSNPAAKEATRSSNVSERSTLFHHRSSSSKHRRAAGHIPVQSRVEIGGKVFMYSEMFRPVRTNDNSSGGGGVSGV